MKTPRHVKQFYGLREIRWLNAAVYTAGFLSLYLSQLPFAFAGTYPVNQISGANQSGFSGEAAKSEKINQAFNGIFQHHLNKSGDSNKRDATKYLLSLSPLLTDQDVPDEAACSTNISDRYCQLQKAFLNLSPTQFNEASIKNPADPELEGIPVRSLVENTIEPSLLNNETMVVVIPGIFGEFINQTAFGEIFGEGDAVRNLESSNFSKEFKNSLSKCSENRSNNSCYDGRFSLSRWTPVFDGKPAINFKNPNHIHNEFIDEWIKVASVDTPSRDKTLFKVVVLKLKAMSMESIGNQSVLADIYLRRFHKFMEFYTNTMKHKTPSRIIFIGYSRGTPVGYEMLAKLNSKEPKYDIYKNSSWSKNITGMVSVAGVVFGSSLADASVVDPKGRNWSKTPVKTKIIQSMRFLANKFIPMPVDAITLQEQLKNGNLGRITANNTHVLKILQQNISALQRQLDEEVKAINNGIQGSTGSQSQIEIVQKAKGHAYTLADKNASLEQKLTELGKLKALAKQIDWSGLRTKLEILLENAEPVPSKTNNARLEIYTLLQNYIRIQNDAKTIHVLAALNGTINEITDAFKALNQNDLSQIENTKILKMLSNLWAIADQLDPKELLLNIQDSLAAKKEGSGIFQDSLKRFPKDLIQKVTDLWGSLPDSQASLAMNAQLMKNWGAEESIKRILIATKGSQIEKTSAIINEINLNLAKFFFYFNRAWEGAYELGTASRLQWWQNRGPLLPSGIRYYSISGILDQPSQLFYKKGIGYGWNEKTFDDLFLVLNHGDLLNVGKNDGLSMEYAGSRINDSQVDLYKTFIWPSVAKELTKGHCFDSKIIGLARTHHWGLTLPYAFTNLDSQKKAIANPFPREVLLNTIVNTITLDLETNENICNANLQGPN